MAQSTANNMVKKLIRIDVSSDTVCPWCFVGKKNLDSAIASSKIHYDFKIVWHPFFLDPSAPKEGVNKKEFYRNKFGSRADQMHSRMTEVFKNVGLEYNMSGLTGNSMDSHRLIHLAGQQDLGKQHDLIEELFLGYFTQGKYIGDRQFLVESANKVGVEGAAEFLQGPANGMKEMHKFPSGYNKTMQNYSFGSIKALNVFYPLKVHEEIKKYSANISGVPFYKINGKHQLSGAQPPEAFLRTFSVAAADST